MKNTWIGDSSASCHIMNKDSQFKEVLGSCQLQRKANFASMSDNLMELNGFTLDGQ